MYLDKLHSTTLRIDSGDINCKSKQILAWEGQVFYFPEKLFGIEKKLSYITAININISIIEL